MKKNVITVVTIIVILYGGTNILNSITSNDNQILRSDIEPITKRFPALSGQIVDCSWMSGVINEDKSLIGPDSYWIEAFLSIDPKYLAQIRSDYKWFPEKPKVINKFNKVDIAKYNWVFSQKFCNEIQNTWLCWIFIGSDESENIMYLYAESK